MGVGRCSRQYRLGRRFLSDYRNHPSGEIQTGPTDGDLRPALLGLAVGIPSAPRWPDLLGMAAREKATATARQRYDLNDTSLCRINHRRHLYRKTDQSTASRRPNIKIGNLTPLRLQPYLDFARLRAQLSLPEGDILLWAQSLPPAQRGEAFATIAAFEQDGVDNAEWNDGARETLAEVQSRCLLNEAVFGVAHGSSLPRLPDE